MAYEAIELSAQEKHWILLNWLYPKMPTDRQAAFEQGMAFLNQNASPSEEQAPFRIFSFEFDSALIYAAFQQTHRIDLQTVELHWYQFLAFFNDLNPNTTFCQIRDLRYRIKKGLATREERQAAQEIPELINLPEFDIRSYAEKLKDKRLMEIINGR